MDSHSTVNTLDAAVIGEDVFEAMEEEQEEEVEEEPEERKEEAEKEEVEEEESESEEVEAGSSVKKTQPRGKSLRLSQVPLPFSSRRSVWDGGERDRSSPTSSMTSEPPPTIEEPIVKPRRRRHSDAAVSSPALRRSTRLSSSFIEEALLTPSTPSKTKVTRRSRLRSQADELPESPLPPSVDVSPTGSSVPGTPMRRSARIALREGTPEPTIPLPVLPEALTTSVGRIRRHSAGPSDTSAVSSPLRRSGRKLNISRDNSPTDSVTSEPPPRTETTPSRKRPARVLKSAQKSGALNLFPVEEESELLFATKPLTSTIQILFFIVYFILLMKLIYIGNVIINYSFIGIGKVEAQLADSDDSAVASPLRRSGRKLMASRDTSPTDSVTSESEPRRSRKPRTRTSKVVEPELPEQTELPEQMDLPPLPDTDSDSASDDDQVEGKSQKKTRSQSSAGSVSSSPISGRYNLRRTRRASELEIISEEAASSQALPIDAPSAPKRRRPSQTETSETTTTPSTSESSVKATRSTRRKKKKVEADPPVAEAAEAEAVTEEPAGMQHSWSFVRLFFP